MSDKVRVRFAPSPTGSMHVGNARTAIFNWLFARHHEGTFVLRIEDTDQERSTDEALEVILDGLRWLGVEWDEGPFFQSKSVERHQAVVEELIAKKKAYRCCCKPEEVEERRKQAKDSVGHAGYDGACRDRTEPRDGVAPTVRLLTPDAGVTRYEDLIQGTIETQNKEISDRIILRSDGTPTYNLCCVVDDHDMDITHVIRGADHMTNTPVQVLMYEAMGWTIPKFAHQSLILGPDRSKLSKRHGSVKVTEYRDEGILPEALVNGLLRLGWSHGDQELFTKQEMVDLFDLAGTSRAPSIFDMNKLRNLFNQHYLLKAEPERLQSMWVLQLEGLGLHVDPDDPRLALLFEPLRERARTVREMAEQAKALLSEQVVFEEKPKKKHLKPKALGALEALADGLEALPADAPGEAIMETFHGVADKLELKLGKVAQPARVAMVGTDRSPGIDLVVRAVGLDVAVARLRSAAADLKAQSEE